MGSVTRKLRRATNFRSCGACSACCMVMHIPELDKPPHAHCPHQLRGIRQTELDLPGWHPCGIYQERPDSCRAYNCLWLRGDLFRTKKKKNREKSIAPLRPDKIGVIFDNASEDGQIVAREVWDGALEQQSDLIMKVAGKVGHVILMHKDGRKGIV